MHPFIRIFGILVPTYGLLTLAAVVIGTLVTLSRVKRYGIPREKAFYALLFAFIGMLVGAKLLYLIPRVGEMWANRGLLFSNPAQFAELFVSGGLVFYGGLIGALIMLFIYCRCFGLSVLGMMDAAAPAIPAAHAVGRIGCLLAGCCYGLPHDGPLAIVNHHAVGGAPDGVPLFPIQPLESLINLVIAGMLFIVEYSLVHRARAQRKRVVRGEEERRSERAPSRLPQGSTRDLAESATTKPGFLMGLYLMLYGIARFGLEFLRGDPARGVVFGMSTSQFIGILLLVTGGFLCFFRFPQKGKTGHHS